MGISSQQLLEAERVVKSGERNASVVKSGNGFQKLSGKNTEGGKTASDFTPPSIFK